MPEQVEQQQTPEQAEQHQTPAGEPPEGQGEQQGGQQEGRGGDVLARTRREAAGYRTRLREAEAERDGLRQQIERYRRQEIDALVSDRLDPGDFGLLVEMTELLDDDGAVDPEKVNEAVDRVLAERPHWKKQAPPVDFGGGARGTRPQRPSFGQALKNAMSGQ